jgi:hypothetical protein
MTIDTLLKALPPPAAPVEAFRGPWAAVEAEIGTTLPRDYKDFVRVYGSGQFLDFFSISVPWSWYRDSRLAAEIPVVRDNFANDEDLPYPLWPEAGGLLPSGRSDFGDLFFWLTRGAPEAWPIVFWDRGMGGFEVFDCDLTDFLAGVLTGRIQPKQFPSDALSCDLLFDPTEDGRPL